MQDKSDIIFGPANPFSKNTYIGLNPVGLVTISVLKAGSC